MPLFGQWVDPRLEQPDTKQTNVGWSHELTTQHGGRGRLRQLDGDDLNIRPRLNQLHRRRLDAAPRRPAGADAQPELHRQRGRRSAAASSEYNALILGMRRRLSQRRRLHRAPTRCRAAGARSAPRRRAGHAPTSRTRTTRSTIRGSSGRTADRRAAPHQRVGAICSSLGLHRRADLPLPLGAAGRAGRRPRPQPGRRPRRHPDGGVPRGELRQGHAHDADQAGSATARPSTAAAASRSRR